MRTNKIEFKNIHRLFFIIVVLICVLFSSCTKKIKNENIIFDNSYPLALAPDVKWAVVIEPYAAYRSESSRESGTKSYCRKGEILQVLGNFCQKDKENWYLFEKGWLPESSVMVYTNRYKAEAYVIASNNNK